MHLHVKYGGFKRIILYNSKNYKINKIKYTLTDPLIAYKIGLFSNYFN